MLQLTRVLLGRHLKRWTTYKRPSLSGLMFTPAAPPKEFMSIVKLKRIDRDYIISLNRYETDMNLEEMDSLRILPDNVKKAVAARMVEMQKKGLRVYRREAARRQWSVHYANTVVDYYAIMCNWRFRHRMIILQGMLRKFLEQQRDDVLSRARQTAEKEKKTGKKKRSAASRKVAEQAALSRVFPTGDGTRHMLRDYGRVQGLSVSCSLQRLLDEYAVDGFRSRGYYNRSFVRPSTGRHRFLRERVLFYVYHRNHPDMPLSFTPMRPPTGSFPKIAPAKARVQKLARVLEQREIWRRQSRKTKFTAQINFLQKLYKNSPPRERAEITTFMLKNRRSVVREVRRELQMWAPLAMRFFQSPEFLSTCTSRKSPSFSLTYANTERWAQISKGQFKRNYDLVQLKKDFSGLDDGIKKKYFLPILKRHAYYAKLPSSSLRFLVWMLLIHGCRDGEGSLKLRGITEAEKAALVSKVDRIWHDMDTLQKAAIGFQYMRPLTSLDRQRPKFNKFLDVMLRSRKSQKRFSFEGYNKWRSAMSQKWRKLSAVEKLKYETVAKDFTSPMFPLLAHRDESSGKKSGSRGKRDQAAQAADIAQERAEQASIAKQMTTLTLEDLQKITEFDDDSGDADDIPAGATVLPSVYFPKGAHVGAYGASKEQHERELRGAVEAASAHMENAGVLADAETAAQAAFDAETEDDEEP